MSKTTSINAEDRKLFYFASKRHHSDSNNKGIQLTGPLEFNSFLNNIETKLKLDVEITNPKTKEYIKVKQSYFYSSSNGIILITVNTGGWAKPYYSIDMIATRKDSAKMLLGIARELREAYLTLPVKLPILIDTVNPVITKRVFDKRISDEVSDVVVFKVREVLIAYSEDSQLPTINDKEVENQIDLECMARK